MQVSRKNDGPNQVTLTIIASPADLQSLKDHVLGHFAERVKVPGFRSGKAPLTLIEKQVDPNSLQSEFLEEALGNLYQTAAVQEKLRVVAQPEITITKFVPFTDLEFTASVPVIGDIKLADYKKVTLSPPEVKVTADDVKNVLISLQTRLAERQTVDRAAKADDEVIIDFQGVDAKSQPIQGAEGKDYPLVLGSEAFIPGFEKNVSGLKPGEEKVFTLKFPKDYGVKVLAGKPVTFTVTLKEVHELQTPHLDDTFATKAGPFKTLTELKDDIKRQLTIERQREAELQFESELVETIARKSHVSVPQVLVDDMIERLLQDLRQNLAYRGQTYQEFLEAEGKTEKEYRKDVLIPEATKRVSASLVLSEIAEQEKVAVSNEEIDDRLAALKAQYQDPTVQAELAKPEARQDIANRLLTEKTIKKLKLYAT